MEVSSSLTARSASATDPLRHEMGGRSLDGEGYLPHAATKLVLEADSVPFLLLAPLTENKGRGSLDNSGSYDQDIVRS